MGHGVIALFSPIIVEQIGIPVNLLQFQPTELILDSGVGRLGFGRGILAGRGRLPHRRGPLADVRPMTARRYQRAIDTRGEERTARYRTLDSAAVAVAGPRRVSGAVDHRQLAFPRPFRRGDCGRLVVVVRRVSATPRRN